MSHYSAAEAYKKKLIRKPKGLSPKDKQLLRQGKVSSYFSSTKPKNTGHKSTTSSSRKRKRSPEANVRSSSRRLESTPMVKSRSRSSRSRGKTSRKKSRSRSRRPRSRANRKRRGRRLSMKQLALRMQDALLPFNTWTPAEAMYRVGQEATSAFGTTWTYENGERPYFQSQPLINQSDLNNMSSGVTGQNMTHPSGAQRILISKAMNKTRITNVHNGSVYVTAYLCQQRRDSSDHIFTDWGTWGEQTTLTEPEQQLWTMRPWDNAHFVGRWKILKVTKKLLHAGDSANYTFSCPRWYVKAPGLPTLDYYRNRTRQMLFIVDPIVTNTAATLGVVTLCFSNVAIDVWTQNHYKFKVLSDYNYSTYYSGSAPPPQDITPIIKGRYGDNDDLPDDPLDV